MDNETSCSNNIQHLLANVPNSAVHHEMWGSRKAEWNNNKVVYKLIVTKQIAGNISSWSDSVCINYRTLINVRSYT